MGSTADALNVARSFLGTAENPAGSNRTPIGAEYGWNGVAWCDEFVTVVLRRVNLAPGPIDSAHFASCWFHVQAYKRGECGEWLGRPAASDLRPGDQGFLGTSGEDHTFFVEAVHASEQAITTVEGNLSDSVRRAYRKVASCYGFGRPRYDEATGPGLPPPSMTEGRPILRNGSIGEGVKREQEFLNAFAHAGLEVDGIFGAATDAAVRSWQRDRGLKVDGEVGIETYRDEDRAVAYVSAIANAAQQPAESVPPFPGTVRLGSGNRPAVAQVQLRLQYRGWAIEADGIFGPKTEKIVEAFQREKGLRDDGIVGPVTWAALWQAPVT